MAKYYGNIGFAVQEESEPGIWEDVITSRPYKGDVLRNGRRWETTDNINDDFVITNQFSIIADTFLYSHIPSMRYLEYMGVKIDPERNNVRGDEHLISADDSAVKVFVIATNEELMIARDTQALVETL